MPTTIIENLKKDPIVTSSAIPIEAIEKAVENLHSYCCSSEILSKTILMFQNQQHFLINL